MAKFYGNLKGSRGEATRCGTGSSGISVSARSWNGSISVEMGEGETPDDPEVVIRAGNGSTTSGRALYCGPLSGLLSAHHLIPAGPDAPRSL